MTVLTSTSPPAQIQAALTPIPGNTAEISAAAQKFHSAVTEFQDSWTKSQNIHNSIGDHWQSKGSSNAQQAMAVALGRSQYAHQASAVVAHALEVYATELETAQDDHKAAVTHIQHVMHQMHAQPHNQTLRTDLDTWLQRLDTANQNADGAGTAFATAIGTVTGQNAWYATQAYGGHYDAMEAAVLDHLVAHGYISTTDAAGAQQSLTHMSDNNYQQFSQMEAGATGDAAQGDLIKRLVGGQIQFAPPPAVPVVISQTAQPVTPQASSP